MVRRRKVAVTAHHVRHVMIAAVNAANVHATTAVTAAAVVVATEVAVATAVAVAAIGGKQI